MGTPLPPEAEPDPPVYRELQESGIYWRQHEDGKGYSLWNGTRQLGCLDKDGDYYEVLGAVGGVIFGPRTEPPIPRPRKRVSLHQPTCHAVRRGCDGKHERGVCNGCGGRISRAKEYGASWEHDEPRDGDDGHKASPIGG